MNRQDKKEQIRIVLFVILIIITLALLMGLPDILGLYDKMIGHQSLKKIISAILLKDFTSLLMIAPLVVLGFIMLKYTSSQQSGIKKIFHTVFFAAMMLAVPLLILLNTNRTRFNELSDINNYSVIGNTGDIKLLSDCISDYFSDQYDEYSAAYADFGYARHTTTSGGKGSPTYHNEYTIAFYSDAHRSDKSLVIKTQVGSDEFKYYEQHLTCGNEIKLTVYRKSGLLRSIEYSEDFSQQDGYCAAYKISYTDNTAVYEKCKETYDIKQLQWCGFKDGQNNNIKNSLFAVNAQAMTVFENPFEYIDIGQICLYGYVDGEYKRVSNILYRDEAF